MIKLNDKYSITSDPDNWMLCRYKGVRKTGDRKGEEHWRPIKYYASIERLVAGATALMLRESQYDSFSELLSSQRRIEALIADKLKDIPTR